MIMCGAVVYRSRLSTLAAPRLDASAYKFARSQRQASLSARVCVRARARDTSGDDERVEAHERRDTWLLARESYLTLSLMPRFTHTDTSRPHEYTHVHAAATRGAGEKRVTGIIVQDDW